MYLRLKLKKGNHSVSRRKTIFWVVIGHVSVFLLIFLVFFFKGCTTKKPRAIKVNIISSSQLSARAALQQSQKQPKKVNKLKPKEKTVIKKTIPRKKWKALDPSQIKKSTTTVVKKIHPKKITPVKTSDIAKNLRREFKKIKFDSTYGANDSVLNYYDEVSQYLYSRWQQPSRSLTGSETPVVQVRVSIDANGKILDASIIKKSSIVAMDSSVNQLLSKLSSLPHPPEGPMEFDIYLELTD